MEIDGHPTQDIVEELERRGALRVEGNSGGPNVQALRFLAERFESAPGFWLFLPNETFLTGFDEPPQ
ncbi:MAG: hypothetical protein ABR505_03075 [Actinomycetota bacterium]